MTEIYCENCGQELNGTAKFCENCGHPTKTNKKFCNNCGKEIKENEDYCSDCGTNLNEPQVKKSVSKINNNRIIIIALVVIIILIVISGIFVLNGNTKTDVGTQNVEVGSTNFIIPGDYKIDPSTTDVDYKDASAVFTQAWVNDNGDIIYISTMTVPYGVDADGMIQANGGVQDTKMGYTGYYVEKDDLYMFSFKTGGYVCLVGVSDPNAMDSITCLG